MFISVDIKLLAVNNGVGDDGRITTSPHVKHIHGDRVSSRAYLYGATLKFNEKKTISIDCFVC